METLVKFGIDWHLLLAQIVNFVVLLLVLRRFVYRPMLAFLEERSARIDQGLKDADSAAKKLSEAEAKEREILEQAKREAQELLAKSEAAGKRQYEKTLEQAKADADRVMEQAQAKMEAERAKLLSGAKAELADLVVLATGKVLGEKVDAKRDEEIIRKHIDESK